MVGRKSSATVQQMQPFASSRTSSSSQPSMPQPLTISASIPMSPNSLMTRARRRPLAWARRWRMRLVLPAPRKPVITVAGMRVVMGGGPSFDWWLALASSCAVPHRIRRA